MYTVQEMQCQNRRHREQASLLQKPRSNGYVHKIAIYCTGKKFISNKLCA
ncbi:hypothetical protein SAMN04489803_3510 [Pseudomonas chlororaphis]|nr:hypothetical protein SAMN04489803_3510 [Pseudomonas chlororaphis]SUD24341.1 Uncharacterised protein [Pseudomonas chlororaphis]